MNVPTLQRPKNIRRKTLPGSIICLLFLCLFSCVSNGDILSPEDFPNVEQEQLGDQLWEAITVDDSPYDILDREGNEKLYTHIETLYKQSYFLIRANGRWSVNRDWRLAIFVDDNESAISFPGGNIMISTGMLKAFRKEYELFYLFSFENALIDSGHLFSNFLSFIEDSIDVERLINQADNEMALSLAQEMSDLLTFNDLITQEVDKAAIGWICESSVFRVDGIINFLPRLSPESKWTHSRMSSLDRLDSVVDFEADLNCDNEELATTLGDNFYIDTILPLIP